jgi:hypothetical protein
LLPAQTKPFILIDTILVVSNQASEVEVEFRNRRDVLPSIEQCRTLHGPSY